MPVVNSPNFVDRLRDIKKRIDIRPSLQNASRRWQGAYEALAVGSPYQVQEFYKYIKVYKQCPTNDLLFMNMTVQLARASLFPTDSMFKQMFKFEKHMDELIRSEGYQNVFGSYGMSILSSHNRKFMERYLKYKRRVVRKHSEKVVKKAQKDAKVLAAVKEARMKTTNAEIQAQLKTVPVVQCPAPVVVPEISRWEYSKAIELIEPAPVHAPAQSQETPVSQKEEKDDVAMKLNEVIGLLMKEVRAENKDEEEEEEEEEDEAEESQEEEEEVIIDFAPFIPPKPTAEELLIDPEAEDSEVAVESEDEELEKIEDQDVDALEYEML